MELQIFGWNVAISAVLEERTTLRASPLVLRGLWLPLWLGSDLHGILDVLLDQGLTVLEAVVLLLSNIGASQECVGVLLFDLLVLDGW